MAMTIKDKNEVGAYIDLLLNERQWKQADLSKKLTELEGRPVSRDNVCKYLYLLRYVLQLFNCFYKLLFVYFCIQGFFIVLKAWHKPCKSSGK